MTHAPRNSPKCGAGGWQGFQRRLVDAIVPLTADQLALPVAPGQRPIGVLAQHLVVNRVWSSHGWLGEGGAWLAARAARGPIADARPPSPTAGELASALEATWRMVGAALTRWTVTDLADTPPPSAFLPEDERRDGQRLQRRFMSARRPGASGCAGVAGEQWQVEVPNDPLRSGRGGAVRCLQTQMWHGERKVTATVVAVRRFRLP